MRKATKLLKLPNEPSECVIKEKTICSNDTIIHNMKQFLQKIGKKIKDDSDKTKIMQEMFNITNCKSESCVLKDKKVTEFIGKKEIEKNLKENFMPRGPSHKFDWLSNKHIDDVLEIYVKQFASQKFCHIPFQLIDFSRTETELAQHDFVKCYRDGNRTVGCVINTDYSTSGRGGIHWFSIFIDFRDPNIITIEYFNSVPGQEPKEIRIWANKTKHKISKGLNKPVEYVRINRLKHQTDTHSCGPYSLYYIWSRLNKEKYNYFTQYEVGDFLMHKFRKYLFMWEI